MGRRACQLTFARRLTAEVRRMDTSEPPSIVTVGSASAVTMIVKGEEEAELPRKFAYEKREEEMDAYGNWSAGWHFA